MMQPVIYEVKDIDSARKFLSLSQEKVILTNGTGSIRYYGMRVMDYIFTTLKKEFPCKISSVIINSSNDYAGFITARQLGYRKYIIIN